LAAVAVLVEVLGLLHHGRGDVHPVHLFEMMSQRLRKTAHTTSEIERPALR